MQAPPVNLYRPSEVAELDRATIEDFATDGYELMTRAGRAAYTALRGRWPNARRLLVLCGGGNNGGDGYVIARLAAEDGLIVRVMAMSDPGRLEGSAAAAAADCRGVLSIEAFDAAALGQTDIVVDALLGTGLDRPVAGGYAEAIAAVNASALPVLAVDIPSGISGDTGAALGSAVQAAVTVTFIGVKRGLLTGDGPEHTGELVFEGLSVPDAVYDRVSSGCWRVTAALARRWLPERPRGAHKGRYGHVLVVGGDHGMGGAARLAAEAAARSGAGLVSVATRPAHTTALLAGRPEIMVHGLEADEVLPETLLARASVVALGPGLSLAGWGRARFAEAAGFSGPCVVDADGLNQLAEAPTTDDQRVITPHPGEAGRLLGMDAAAVQADRFAAVEALQQRYGGVVVLKGPGTLIGTPGGGCWLCDRGNPGMASGGMGDVLTGVIAGLLSQGIPPVEAAALGVWLHAGAGDAAAVAGGERGLLAGDVVSALRREVNP